MKKVAILQSNYIPWKGYFDMIAAVDEFIIYDDMQFTKNDWRNRNIIKTSSGPQWLSIPVGSKIDRTIRQVELPSNNWKKNHWQTISQNYKKAPYYKEIAAILEPIYLDYEFTKLTDLNRCLIQEICSYLSITTKITNSWDYSLIEGKTERLVDLCLQAGASEYISGPAARNYIDEPLFSEKNVTLTWFVYNDYPEYPQLWGDFIHNVSAIDLLFNCGKNSINYIR